MNPHDLKLAELIINNSTAVLFRRLAAEDPEQRRMVYVSPNISRFGYQAEYDLLPDDSNEDLMAILHLGEKAEPTLRENKLFEAIFHRRTNRLPFKSQNIPLSDLESLRSAVEAHGATLDIITDSTKRKLAELIADGDRIQGSDKHFRRELAAWIHPSRSQSKDGIPGYSAGVRDLTSSSPAALRRASRFGP